jgi:glycosyltransferase involved in cell wall biosynthesis
MNPKVSIIIPCFKVAQYISEALDSVFAQTFTDYEVIVINDGSPDTLEFEKEIKKYLEKIIYIKHENIGVGPSRNIGIKHSKGELLAFLDGDDVWFPTYLQEQIEFLEKNKLDLVYTDALYFGDVFTTAKTFMEDSPSKGETTFESLLSCDCNIILSGSIVRKKPVLDIGMFDPRDVRAQDYDLWLRLTHAGAKVGYQRKVLLKYRVRRDSISGNSQQRIQREIDAYDRITKKLELNENQQKIIDERLSILKTALEIERGKGFLLQEDFENARKIFEKANEMRRSLRLKGIILMLKIAPKILLKFYRSKRADEIKFVSTEVK